MIKQEILDAVLDMGKRLSPRVTIRSVETPRGRNQGTIVALFDTLDRYEQRVELPVDIEPEDVRELLATAAADLILHQRILMNPRDTVPVRVSTKRQPSLLPV